MREDKKVLPEIPPYKNAIPISSKFIMVTIIGIILLLVIVHVGFYKTYIQFFPTFDGFKTVQHFHGMMMIGWLLMLILQPFLILKGKTKLHRRVGAMKPIPPKRGT
ncbi:MAG TPA: hypothetical protein VGQ09_02205 [Chitinophagaceae bacterium]|nr:hypothetical protein [Chitinophagaceae bacterium]